ncbi:MAG: hypothetical protein KDJ98_08150 [Rhodobacteraceae bacterium]|nr:hypothetical protein [Paracoccaceae bacterium]
MKHPRAHVTDHAVLRYLERVAGVDIEAIRCRIGRAVDRAALPGATGVVIEGMSYRLQHADDRAIVVTVRPANAPDRRLGRQRRTREVDG